MAPKRRPAEVAAEARLRRVLDTLPGEGYGIREIAEMYYAVEVTIRLVGRSARARFAIDADPRRLSDEDFGNFIRFQFWGVIKHFLVREGLLGAT